MRIPLDTSLVLAAACVQVAALSNYSAVVAPLTTVQTSPQAALPAKVYRNKRSIAVNEPLNNLKSYYTLNISIGTPPQPVAVLLDTGSSDLWVPLRKHPRRGTGFLPSFSRTWVSLRERFRIKYIKGSAAGAWGKDIVDVGKSISLFNQKFAVAAHMNDIAMGVLGLGPVNTEASSSANLYDNIPMKLVKQGAIAKNLYSIYLGEWGGLEGSIVFGGIDVSKFIPPLHTVQLTSTRSFTIEVTGLRVEDTVLSRSFIDVMLDTGTSLMYLPDSHVNAIAAAYGAGWDDNGTPGYHTVHRDALAHGPPSITFDIQGLDITIPKSELFWPLSWFRPGSPPGLMALAIVSSRERSGGVNLLGANFLRSAYVVFDLEYRQVSLAQSMAGWCCDRVDCSRRWDARVVPIRENVPGTRPAKVLLRSSGQKNRSIIESHSTNRK